MYLRTNRLNYCKYSQIIMRILYSTWCLRISLLTILELLAQFDSAQILGIFPTHSRSLHAIYQPIVRGLAKRGHNVTVISYFPPSSTQSNYTELVLENGLPSYVDSISIDEASYFKSVRRMFLLMAQVEPLACETVLRCDYIKQLISSETKRVDLILAESYGLPCYSLLARKLGASLILISFETVSVIPDVAVGNPKNPSYMPVCLSSYTSKMNFIERLMNTYYYVIFYAGPYWYYNNNLKGVAWQHLKTELPAMDVLYERVSMVFSNNHFSLINRPLAPSSISIAGIHIKEPKPLPSDLQKFIDDAEHGVIFFSFGTTLKASSLPLEKLNIISRVFSKIPQRVLWRIDDPRVVNMPQNVKVSTWFAQRDILEHKNVRAFISHCGISSTMEAIYTATPVIAMPFVFDQIQNGNILVEKGVAVYVEYDTLTEDEFLSAINEIINNTEYGRNMRKWSSILKDRPMPPLETALYWCEYVLKYKGAPHLRPQAASMPMYQYLLLDVIAFALTIPILTIWLVKFLIQSFLAQCWGRSKMRKVKQG